jgi:hypothetical protein
VVPSRTSGTKNIRVVDALAVVPSRTSGTKYIKVVEALAVVEALETTAYINSILELI